MNSQDQLINKIKDSENILITVGNNPNVDVLSACLGLALAIDKMRKHTLAIFSGQIPPIMSFLKPEKTFEDSTAGFADFIISLDKSKADKLRYKVEGDMVKIFITPYHTTISPDDLQFSEGDLNVDMLIAIGVRTKNDIDKAAYAHGKILHSATIATINLGEQSDFGTINYASNIGSYSETMFSIIEEMGDNIISRSIATALLTGIVIETGQFSNAKTTPATMAVASRLLAYGADQQLIVKEIKASNYTRSEEVVNSEPNIPLEVESQVLTPNNNPVTEAVDSEPKVEPSMDQLTSYMPPPLPNFDTNLPPLSDTKPETLPKAKPEPEPQPTNPSQFRIPM